MTHQGLSGTGLSGTGSELATRHVADRGAVRPVARTGLKAAARAVLAGAALLAATALPAAALDQYVSPDAESGVTADGSRDRPWPSIDKAIWKVEGGDRIILKDGAYGALFINRQNYSKMLTIEAEHPHRVQVEWISILLSRNITVRGLNVWSTKAVPPKIASLVYTRGDATDIVFDDLDIRPVENADFMNWSKSDWTGIYAMSGVKLNGARSELRNSHLTGIGFGVTTYGEDSRVINNVIDGFGGDAMRGIGDRSVFQGNRITNCFKIDGNHDDGFQSWATRTVNGQKVVTGTVIADNTIIEWTGPKNHPLRGTLQGISLFDGMYKDFVIRNNVVAVRAYHGITVTGGTNVKIVNNTVTEADGKANTNYPWIGVFDAKNGTRTKDTLIANNLSVRYMMKAKEKQRQITNTNPTIRYPANAFVSPETFDFRPIPTSKAINAADRAYIPSTDVMGTRRPQGKSADIGAFEVR